MKIVKNSIANFVGLAIPIIVAIYCIPILIKELGDAKFGMLTLIWAFVGYFSFFDFGIGRALTQQLAVVLAEKDFLKVPSLIGTSLYLMMILGLTGALLIIAIIYSLSNHDFFLKNESDFLWSFVIMAAALPLIILSAGFRGVLEAINEFAIINWIRLPLGIFTFLAPLIVLSLGYSDLRWICLSLVFARFIACIANGYFAIKRCPYGNEKLKFDQSWIKKILFNGGWITVSNLVSPAMGYLDRFIIAATVSAAAVAYYVTPQEIVLKIGVIPGALTAVIFPAFAANFISSIKESQKLFLNSTLLIFYVVLPVSVFFSIFSYEFLKIWISEDFSKNAYVLFSVFSLGILINSMAHIPFTAIQASGNSKLTAIIHLIEFPVFIFLMYFMIERYGILGASICWIMRILFDTFLMYFFGCSVLKINVFRLIKEIKFSLLIILTLPLVFALSLSEVLVLKVSIFVIYLTTSIIWLKRNLHKIK